jgi:hypothetical protein
VTEANGSHAEFVPQRFQKGKILELTSPRLHPAIRRDLARLRRLGPLSTGCAFNDRDQKERMSVTRLGATGIAYPPLGILEEDDPGAPFWGRFYVRYFDR